jgi:parvulin-like peptidyl-prolyl isomerase
MKKRLCIAALLYILGISLVANLSCRKSKEGKNVVAQVGGSVLTLQELQDNFPSEYRHLIRREQYLDFIQRWIDEEILLQQAMEEKLHLKSEIKRKISEQRRKVIVEEYLTSLSRNYSYAPDEEAIQQHYQEHESEFLRREPEIRYAEIVVKSLKEAWLIRKKVKENNFLSLVKNHSLGEQPNSLDELPFKKFNELDSCISSAAFSTIIGGATSPVNCGDKYHIIRIIDKQGRGTVKPLKEVTEEITNILISKGRKKYTREKIEELKSDIFLAYNLDLIPKAFELNSTDSSQYGQAE